LRVIRNSRRIQDIHNQVLEHRKTHTTPKEMTVVCVARLSGQKNQAVLIDAWSQLPTPRPKLVLVGDGDDRAKLEQKILDQRLQTDVELVGHVNDPQPYLARGNVFILPSLAEGLPGALIEAMAAGLPCIATDIPGNNELVIHERTGLLVPVNDAPAVAAAVTRLMNHPDEAARLAAAGRKHMQEFFDEAVEREAWRNLAAEMLEAKP
jgi:glycosyltransferase involved in cell wall biosynthesis